MKMNKFKAASIAGNAIENLSVYDKRRLEFIQEHINIALPWIIEKVAIYVVYHCDDSTDIEDLSKILDYLGLLED